jgi:hypothetical protein
MATHMLVTVQDLSDQALIAEVSRLASRERQAVAQTASCSRRRGTRASGMSFVRATGRCSETGVLEFHHVVPYAAGGQVVVENIELRCRAHNAYESEQYVGTLFVRERRWSAWDSVRIESFPLTSFHP